MECTKGELYDENKQKYVPFRKAHHPYVLDTHCQHLSLVHQSFERAGAHGCG